MTVKGTTKPAPSSNEIRTEGQLRMTPLGMSEETIRQNVGLLNQLVDDSFMIYDLYKKCHWQVAGPTFYQLHLLFDKHAEEIEHSIDLLAERIQSLGGIVRPMPRDVVDRTRIEPPPSGEESASAMLKRLVNAHATIIKSVREAIEASDRDKDYGTNDLLVSDILRLHELQTWFINQHLVEMQHSW